MSLEEEEVAPTQTGRPRDHRGRDGAVRLGTQDRQERSSLGASKLVAPRAVRERIAAVRAPSPSPSLWVSVMCGFLWSEIAPNRASFPGAAIVPVGPSFRLSDVSTFPSVPDWGLVAGPGDEGVPGPPGLWFLGRSV